MRIGTLTSLSTLLLVSACTPLAQYRPAYEPCAAPNAEVAGYREAIRNCERSSIERREDQYVLGFVEFDDQGWFWDRAQMDALLETLEGAARESDLLMVVFTHGWKHNAHHCNPNVACFREVLRRLSDDERQMAASLGRPARRVAGIYVGWRGLSLEGFLANLTFWSRKATAERVGSGAVTQLLLELGALRDRIQRDRQGSSTRLVVVGHSFGGAVVYSAVSQNLAASFPGDLSAKVEPSPFGDLVVLVNPAFEAARHQPLHDVANRTGREYPTDQRPLLAIFTSQGDNATKNVFPIGRWFSTRFQRHRGGEQKRSNLRTVGHFAPFRTHFLEPTAAAAPARDDKSRRKDCLCRFQYLEAAAMDLRQAAVGALSADETRFQESVLRRDVAPGPDGGRKSPPQSPVLVVSVDNDIISGHNDIYRPAFIHFLRSFIVLSDAGAAAWLVTPPPDDGDGP